MGCSLNNLTTAFGQLLHPCTGDLWLSRSDWLRLHWSEVNESLFSATHWAQQSTDWPVNESNKKVNNGHKCLRSTSERTMIPPHCSRDSAACPQVRAPLCNELASERCFNVTLTWVAVYWMPSTHLPVWVSLKSHCTWKWEALVLMVLEERSCGNTAHHGTCMLANRVINSICNAVYVVYSAPSMPPALLWLA